MLRPAYVQDLALLALHVECLQRFFHHTKVMSTPSFCSIVNRPITKQTPQGPGTGESCYSAKDLVSPYPAEGHGESISIRVRGGGAKLLAGQRVDQGSPEAESHSISLWTPNESGKRKRQDMPQGLYGANSNYVLYTIKTCTGLTLTL